MDTSSGQSQPAFESRSKGPRIAARSALAGLLLVACQAWGADVITGDGDGEAIVRTPSPCMKELAAAGGISGVNCTANDIRVAGVALNAEGKPDITFLPPPGETVARGCRFVGDIVRFKARFELVLSAQERHDIGIFFSADGDSNGDGAYTSDPGTNGKGCIAATPAYAPNSGTLVKGPWLDLDHTNDPYPGTSKPASGVQDVCGDISDAVDPLYPEIEITTECVDTDQDSKLNLPVCLSWRQPGSNRLCLGPADAFPGAPSKCNCDKGFELDIIVPAGQITVTKSASPTEVNEPGAAVTFTVTVKNDAPSNAAALDVTITSMLDDKFGDITTTGHHGITATTCGTMDKVLSGQETQTCTFTAFVGGKGGTTHHDVVEVSAEDSQHRVIKDTDDADVAIKDIKPSLSITKTANPTSVIEPSGSVLFTVVVKNPATAVEPVTLFYLYDSVYGDLTSACALPKTLAINGTHTCTFTRTVSGAPNTTHTNVVTAKVRDDENNEEEGSASATVDILNSPSDIEVKKSANPTSLKEPGGNVTFTVRVNNISSVDTVFINSLVDNIYGNLATKQGSTCTVPQTIAPGGFYSCTFSAAVTGNAGDDETDIVEACGKDDDNNPLCRSGSVTVNITNATPAATLVKTVKSAKVTYQVDVFNNSAASDPLTLQSLTDTVNGVTTDITQVGGPILSTTCRTTGPQFPIQSPGSYTCEFEALVTDSQTDTVTGKMKDDEGGSVTPDPADSATVNLVD